MRELKITPLLHITGSLNLNLGLTYFKAHAPNYCINLINELNYIFFFKTMPSFRDINADLGCATSRFG